MSTALPPESYDVLGTPIFIINPISAAQALESWAGDNIGRFVCVREVASLMAIREDRSISGLHRDAAMVTPDGMPLVTIGKLRGHPVERVCGPDLMDLMMHRSVASGLKHYFYGGKEGVADLLAANFRRKYPGVQIVGTMCPPFRELDEDEREAVLQEIRASGADIVWVGLSSPKQDVWMWQNYRELPQTLIGVGAAFDFHTGAVKRAPVWMQKSGLEWLHRLGSEPKRLWRRYILLAPKFVALVLFSRLSARTPR